MNILLVIYNVLYAILIIPVGIGGYIFARRKGEYKNYFQRLGFGLPPPLDVPSVWFHAASVGEVRSLKGIVEDVRRRYNLAVVVSVMTENGYNTAVQELKPERVLLMPIENRPVLQNAVKQYHTKIFFITDTEIWPNMLTSIPANVPIILLNGRISDKTFKTYLRFRFIFAPLLKSFCHIIAKSEEDAQRFREITKGKTNVIVGGNIKYTMGGAENPPPLPENITGRVAFAASTHHPEEHIFLQAALEFGQYYDTIVVAPRHIRRAKEVADIIPESLKNKTVVVDRLGMLETIYKASDRIFVGGSITDVGGHNIFEALKYKKPVCVGIHNENFSDITPLAIEYGVAAVVRDQGELQAYFMPKDIEAKFEPFFAALESQQAQYIDIISRCIDDVLAV